MFNTVRRRLDRKVRLIRLVISWRKPFPLQSTNSFSFHAQRILQAPARTPSAQDALQAQIDATDRQTDWWLTLIWQPWIVV